MFEMAALEREKRQFTSSFMPHLRLVEKSTYQPNTNRTVRWDVHVHARILDRKEEEEIEAAKAFTIEAVGAQLAVAVELAASDALEREKREERGSEAALAGTNEDDSQAQADGAGHTRVAGAAIAKDAHPKASDFASPAEIVEPPAGVEVDGEGDVLRSIAHHLSTASSTSPHSPKLAPRPASREYARAWVEKHAPILASALPASVEMALASPRPLVEMLASQLSFHARSNDRRRETRLAAIPTADSLQLVRAEGAWAARGGAELEPLLCSASPLFALVDADWLIALAATGGLLPRRQALPPRAFISLEDLKLAVLTNHIGWVPTGFPPSLP